MEFKMAYNVKLVIDRDWKDAQPNIQRGSMQGWVGPETKFILNISQKIQIANSRLRAQNRIQKELTTNPEQLESRLSHQSQIRDQ